MQKSVSWSNNFSMIGRSSRHKDWSQRLCIKVGWGQGDWDTGMRVGTCDLGTQDEGLGVIKYGTRGRVGRGRGTLNTGMRGRRIQGRGGCE